MRKNFIAFGIALLTNCLCFSTKAGNPIDPRADSFDVQHYSIHLDVTDFAGSTIRGATTVKFKTIAGGLKSLTLELYKLKVDSVFQQSKRLGYFYNDSLLRIKLSSPLSAGDTSSVQVFYHGVPAVDASKFGGLVFDKSGYVYNLGVAFDYLPHTFGRGWFPCVDNFIDKASFSFFIQTLPAHKAFCNGLLKDSMRLADSNMVWHWEQTQIISPYLAGFAAGNYKTLGHIVNLKSGPVPTLIAARPSDAAAVPQGFRHLDTCLHGFENGYGPYPFDKVGYVMVPFSGGAMEHASNIAYPAYNFSAAADETLWAHELSHQWWGNLITCSTAEDMWLNEGFACWSESYFKEIVYGKKAYTDYAIDRHYKVLRYAHLADDTFRAISPMPQAYTYGRHIYWKGADAVHTLRTYMGDQLFFTGIESFLTKYAFKSVATADLKNHLESTFGLNLSDFFSKYIQNPGFQHFTIDSTAGQPQSSAYDIHLTIGQTLAHSPALFNDVPLEITVFDNNWQASVQKIKASGSKTRFTLNLPSKPAFVALNYDSKILDATTRNVQVIKSKTTYTLPYCNLSVKVDSLKDSALLYITNHWIGPERTPGLPLYVKLSKERYWTVDGIFTPGFHATATIQFNGQSPANYYAGGYLDNNLLSLLPEDSLRLLWRPTPQEEWREYPDYKLNTGSLKTDKIGNITITNLRKGEYVFGLSGTSVGIDETSNGKVQIRIFPNPANDLLTIETGLPIESVKIIDLPGHLVYSGATHDLKPQINISDLPNGLYFIEIKGKGFKEIHKIQVLR